MIKRIYMDRSTIARNKKEKVFEPAVCVKTSKSVVRGHEVQIDGFSRVIQQEDPNPAAGGATVWIATTAPIRVTVRQEGEHHAHTDIP